jgi:hypothetical protein
MIIDYRTKIWPADFDHNAKYELSVDGVDAARGAWFIDTEAGIVKTYDVLGDGLRHTTEELLKYRKSLPNEEDLELPPGFAASRVLRGKVEFRKVEGEKINSPASAFATIVPGDAA